MTVVQLAGGQQNAEALYYSRLDSRVRQLVTSTNTMPTDEVGIKFLELLREFGFEVAPHLAQGGKIAVVGVNGELQTKVQAVIAKDGAVCARYNGRVYNFNEAPNWSEYPSGTEKILLYYRKSNS